MVSKLYWKKSIEEFIKLINKESEIKTVDVMNVLFKVLPGVFSPVYSSDTRWFAEKVIPLVKRAAFLEIGAGAGAIACLAKMHGALTVTATDINPQAIKNINLNALEHSLEISIKEGSLFQPFENKNQSDCIFWNHPRGDS